MDKIELSFTRRAQIAHSPEARNKLLNEMKQRKTDIQCELLDIATAETALHNNYKFSLQRKAARNKAVKETP